MGQKDPGHRMLQYSEITSQICIAGRMEMHVQTVGQSPQTGILPHQNDRMYFIDDYDLRSLRVLPCVHREDHVTSRQDKGTL